MQKNEYRRALIMLRSLLNGYSGHARLEVRTLTGNLNIRATLPPGAQSVRAALVGKRSALYFAYPIGNLRRDMRGQAGLSYNFDPRDIGGRPLESYSLLALVTINDGACQLALVGNLNGSTENDWARVRDVVCALYAPEPRPEDLIPAPYGRAADENDAACEGDSCPLNFGELISDEETETPAAEESILSEQDDSADETSDRGLVWDLSVPDAEEVPSEDEIPDIFRKEGWNFSKISLPQSCGFEYAYVGTPACGGEVCVALPAVFSAESPVGLEDYSWSGGLGEGFWVKCYAYQSET